MTKTDDAPEAAAITDRELDLACRVIMVKSILLFFDTSDSEPYGPEADGLLKNWAEVPQERREDSLPEFQRLLWQSLLEGLEGSGPRRRGML